MRKHLKTSDQSAIRILGIDPGYDRLGLAVIEKRSRGAEQLLFSDCVTTSATLTFPERLQCVGEAVAETIERYRPSHAGVEDLYLASNQKTAMRVSAARGVILYEAARAGLTILEFTPLQIKIAITGFGRGDKRAVSTMVDKLLSLPAKKRKDDEYDALATALTTSAHIQSSLRLISPR